MNTYTVEIATMRTRFGPKFYAVQIWKDGAMLHWWFYWFGSPYRWCAAMAKVAQSYMGTTRGLITSCICCEQRVPLADDERCEECLWLYCFENQDLIDCMSDE